MKRILIYVWISIFSFPLIAQEKPPVVGEDYASIMAGDTIVVNVMSNDWCMEGHSMEIFNFWSGKGGSVQLNDSSFTYSSFYNYGGIDTVRYLLVDLDNELYSEAGYFIVSVENMGRDMLDVNNVHAFIQSFGLQFCEMKGDDYYPRYEAPAGSKRNSIFVSNLWLAGRDDNNDLHMAAEKYRSSGVDYWNGPVSELYSNQQIIDYNKVWTLTRDEIESHKENWWMAGYTPIDAISSWPAHGNTSLGQAENLAPFYDRNENGQYEWEMGDYPAIRGDKGIFMIYNDDFGMHGESGGAKIKVEIQGQAYAYDCAIDSSFFNTIFFHYDIISRSELSYHDFYAANYIDFDLGYAWDDFIGCDTLLDACFVYNGDDYDQDDTIYGNIPTYGYRDRPPAQAMVFLNEPMHSFVGFQNYSGINSDPQTIEEKYNAMQGLWKNGTSMTVGGNGIGGDETTRYLYSGNPSDSEQWSEVSNSNSPSDRRGVVAAGPFNLDSGDTLHLDMAFVFARDYQGNQLTSIDLMKDYIAQVKWYFDNDSTPCGKSWLSSPEINSENQHVLLYPNPCVDFIQVEMEQAMDEKITYSIRDIAGRKIDSDKIDRDNKTINTTHLSRGVYIIEITGGGDVIKSKFIKK